MRLMRLQLLSAFALLALAACDMAQEAPPASGALSLRQVAAETQGRPYECTEYQAETDSCEAIARWTISGDVVRAETVFALDEGLPATIRVVSRHRIDNRGRSFGLVGAPRVTVTSPGSPEAKRAIADLFKSVLADTLHDTCAAYSRAGTKMADGAGDGYITEVTDAEGNPLEDGAARSRFFSQPRKLRPVRMQAL